MMIRLFQAHDLDALMTLWLTTTIDAHPFIDPTYWHDSASLVRNVYLPDATTWVYTQNDRPDGFISVMHQQFIGALFVSAERRRSGIGAALMDTVKNRYPKLLLEVYKDNVSALRFYLAQGFDIHSEQPHPETGQITYVMHWQAEFPLVKPPL